MASQVASIKRVANTPFIVDGFNFLDPSISHYFLTHFHSDHYCGLTASFDLGTIYCSPITAALVVQILRVSPKYVVPIQLNKPTVIEGVTVTALDADHCPGSVILHFAPQNTATAVIHTGDFRASDAVCKNRALIELLRQRPVDTLYLDTTYCKPQHTFPNQEVVLQQMGQLAQAEVMRESKTLFIVGSYSIGKERAIEAVAKAVGSKVLVTAQRGRMLKLSNMWNEFYTTDDAPEVAVRVVPMSGAQASHLEMAQLLKHEQNRWKAVCYFRPTGWTYSKKQAAEGYKPWAENEGTTRIYAVPYSEHSSYSQLHDFVAAVTPQRIVPTVNAADRSGRDAQIELFVNSMDLSADKGRIDAYLRPKASNSTTNPVTNCSKAAAAGRFNLDCVDVTSQLAIEAQIRKSLDSSQALQHDATVHQLRAVLGPGVSVQRCEELVAAANGDVATAAAMHFDGSAPGGLQCATDHAPAVKGPTVTVPAGAVVVAAGAKWKLFSSKEQIEKHLHKLGAKVAQRITQTTTHVLVCEGTERETPKRAAEAGALVVPESWLVARVRALQAAPAATLLAKLKQPRRRTPAGAVSGRERSKKWKPTEPACEANGERRAMPFRKLTKAVKDRMDRALSQRMYLVRSTELSLDGGARGRRFELLGSTGNLYTVVVAQQVTCNCVDASNGGGNGHQCKHILFVFLRVLAVSKDSHIVNQKGLLQTELEQILPRGGATSVDFPKDEAVVVRRALEDGPCVICYEDMGEHEACEPTVWCKTRCGNNFHKECAAKWRQARMQANEPTLCPCCRTQWPDDDIQERTELLQVSLAENNEDRNVALQQFGIQLPSERDASTYSEWFRNAS